MLGLGLVLGCGDPARETTFHTSDSAGVRIAVSTAPAWTDATRWRVDSVPLVDVGADENDSTLQFSSIAGARLLPDSTFVVGEASDRTIRRYDLRGALRATAGRKGGGPGEYESLSRLRPAGDSLLAWDPNLKRVSLLDAAGRYGRSYHLDQGRPEGRWSDGSFLVSITSSLRSELPIVALHETLAVVRVRADGTRDALLGRWPWRETIVVMAPGFIASLESPYAPTTTLRWHPAGFWLGRGDGARIDRYDQDGRLVGSVRWSPAAVRIDPGELAAWRTSELHAISALTPGFRPVSLDEAAQRIEFPATRPAYRTFAVSAEGDLWVERTPHWQAERAPGEWEVIESSGRWLGTVRIPAGATPLDIAGGLFLARWDDADGVTHIRLYGISRPE